MIAFLTGKPTDNNGFQLDRWGSQPLKPSVRAGENDDGKVKT